MTKFLKLPNNLFEFKLSPSAFYLYARLALIFKSDSSFKIKLDCIASWCKMSKSTVCRAIRELSDVGLIKKSCTYTIKDHIAYQGQNEYKLTSLGGSFTMIEASVLHNISRIDKTTFVIYCYIKKCSNSNNMAFPSISNIQNATGFSKQTVISKIKKIETSLLIAKTNYIVLSGCFGNNNYHIITYKLRRILMALLCNFTTIFEYSLALFKNVYTRFCDEICTLQNKYVLFCLNAFLMLFSSA